MVNTSFYFTSEAVVRWCSVKKVHLEISPNSQENTYGRVSFLEACNFILLKKETLTQGFSSEFCEVSKNTSGGYICHLSEYLK